MQDKFLSAIGLAKRAGGAVFGTEMVRDSAKKGLAKLIIIAKDVSKNTLKEITDTATFYNTEFIISNYTMTELSSATGLLRSTSSIAVLDGNLTILVKNSLK
jgi:ribosomal protein L7Ae-like RNA K-turn-binding protein